MTKDGVLIQKSGFMTGGLSAVELQRAQRWDDKEVENMKKQRNKILEELAGMWIVYVVG